MNKKLDISALDAAKRQLEHSIKLFFHSGDIVIIHTLSCAAQEVLEKLAKRRGIQSLYQRFKNYIKPDKQKKVMDTLRNPQNFFKHGGQIGSIGFNPESSEFVLFDAITTYQLVTNELPPIMQAFKIWFFMKNDDFIIEQEFKTAMNQVKNKYDYNNRIQFMEMAHYFEESSLI